MHLSKRTQYGLRAAVRLARRFRADEYVQSRDLAEEEALPTKFLEQVLLLLRRGGLLESKVGSGGGYRLQRSPEQITLHELLKVLEPGNDLDLPEPPTLGGYALLLLSATLDRQQEKVVGQWTLADLADEAARKSQPAAEMYYI